MLRSIPALAVVALALAASEAASAQDAPVGRFTVSPAVQVGRGRPPIGLAPTAISNTTPLPYRVTVAPALVRQRLSGVFVPLTDAASTRRARRLLSITPRSLRLDPGSRRQVSARWNAMPGGRKAIALGIVVTGVPLAKKGDAAVAPRSQVVRLNYLTLPGAPPARGSMPVVRAQQGTGQRLVLQSRVKNTGETFAIPQRGTLVVRDADKRVVFERTWAGGAYSFVAPGFPREFPVQMDRLLGAGTYTLESRARFGRDLIRGRGRFRLVGPNTLPVRDVDLIGLGVDAQEGTRVRYALKATNKGNFTLEPTVETALFTRGGREIARITRSLGSFAPRETRTVRGQVGPELERGRYRLVASVSLNGRRLASATREFRSQPRRSFFQRVEDWLRGHWVLLVTLLVAALIAGLALMAATSRRRVRELEGSQTCALEAPAGVAPPGAAVTAAPALPTAAPAAPRLTSAATPVAAPDGEVDVNRADVEQLMRLPGLGRRAAERIVAHRDQHGPFASLDELAQIEGFHSARIDRLRPHVRV